MVRKLAWLSFIPLAPSFVFTPFEPLCAIPGIEEVTFSYPGQSGYIRRETRFRMNEDDIQRWNVEEKHIIQVARVIQLVFAGPVHATAKRPKTGLDRTD